MRKLGFNGSGLAFQVRSLKIVNYFQCFILMRTGIIKWILKLSIKSEDFGEEPSDDVNSRMSPKIANGEVETRGILNLIAA